MAPLITLDQVSLIGQFWQGVRVIIPPSFKLGSSERDGGRIRRQYHPPRTPLQRSTGAAGDDPPLLGPGAAVADRRQESRSLEVFLGDLQTLWQSSQARRRKARTRTGKRTRPDPFEADVTLIEGWLEEEPLLGSRELMERLVAHDPQRYSNRQLRTLQRAAGACQREEGR